MKFCEICDVTCFLYIKNSFPANIIFLFFTSQLFLRILLTAGETQTQCSPKEELVSQNLQEEPMSQNLLGKVQKMRFIL
jgi:hypothetical protein